MGKIVENAKRRIDCFNEVGLHYNLVANQIYTERFIHGVDPFDKSFLKYIIAGLVSFDMGRMMDAELDKKYKIEAGGFASRLSSKLQEIRVLIAPLVNLSLTEINLKQNSDAIKKAYDTLSATGSGALHENKHFYVGATKILHFLNPKLFTIVDSNAAKAFRMAHGIPFRNTTQPGYSASLYMKCMECAQSDIRSYGVEEFQKLEPSVPIMRIYDKLTFVIGSGLDPF